MVEGFVMVEALNQPWWAYLLAGCICGIFSATFGVGSGIIMIPLLVLAFGVGQKSAQGVCLAVMVPIALVGAVRYILNPAIDIHLGTVFLLAVGGVAGAVLGSSLANQLSAVTLRRLFALLMIVAAVRLLATKPALQPTTGEPTPFVPERESTTRDLP
jgi:uncharacterized membrane protein YfcA